MNTNALPRSAMNAWLAYIRCLQSTQTSPALFTFQVESAFRRIRTWSPPQADRGGGDAGDTSRSEYASTAAGLNAATGRDGVALKERSMIAVCPRNIEGTSFEQRQLS